MPTPTDGNDNAADFTVVSTTPGTPVGSTAAPRLGAPGPENLADPNLKKYSQVGARLIDPMVSAVGIAEPMCATLRRIQRTTRLSARSSQPAYVHQQHWRANYASAVPHLRHHDLPGRQWVRPICGP